jgi:hypothetical protein
LLLIGDRGTATWSISMHDTSMTTATLDQAEDDILSYTVSDDALEAAADIDWQSRAGARGYTFQGSLYLSCLAC